MKKYEKPEIHFISFELSESISAGCELITNLAQTVCEIFVNEDGWEGITVYADTKSCGYTPPNGSDKPCYHAPTDSYNVYSS